LPIFAGVHGNAGELGAADLRGGKCKIRGMLGSGKSGWGWKISKRMKVY